MAKLPCEYQGKHVAPPEGKDSRKTWLMCEHPNKPQGPVVCNCQCNANCTGYTVDPVDLIMSNIDFKVSE